MALTDYLVLNGKRQRGKRQHTSSNVLSFLEITQLLVKIHYAAFMKSTSKNPFPGETSEQNTLT